MLCKLCGSKDKENFYPYNSSRCKDCYSSRWGTMNDVAKKEYLKKYRAKNKEKISAYYKKWYKENGRKRNPLQTAAHIIIRTAVRNGTIKKNTECTECGSRVKIEAHHPNYEEPLNVLWMCNQCHRKLHTGQR